MNRTESDDRRKWLSWSWADTVAGVGRKPDADHLKAGTNMEAVRDFSDVIAYLQKAGAKELTVVRSPIAGEQLKTRQRGDRQLKSQHVQSPGRWWGIQNRKRWKELRKPPERLTLTDEQLREMELELADQWRALAERKGWELDHLPKRVRGKMIVPILRAGGQQWKYIHVQPK